jgi:hypothetical protein
VTVANLFETWWPTDERDPAVAGLDEMPHGKLTAEPVVHRDRADVRSW